MFHLKLFFSSIDKLYQKRMCKTLWCGRGEICETKYMPAAEGTKCGHNLVSSLCKYRYIYRNTCYLYKPPEFIIHIVFLLFNNCL